MLITAIEKRKGTVCGVYVEGELAMLLDAEIIYNAGLRAGLEVDQDALYELKAQSDLRHTRERALYLLGVRSHTRKELLEKLTKTSDAEVAEQVTQRMEELGLVNDEEYTRLYLRQLVESKGYGVTRIRQEMYKKGIDRELIDAAVEQLEETVDTQEKILQILRRKYERYLGDKKGVDKTVNALMRLGYRYDDIRHALAALTEQELEDAEE